MSNQCLISPADKCAWTFGKTERDDKGAKFNVIVGDRRYLIQQNWDPERQRCALKA